MAKPTEENRAFFHSIHTLRQRWKDGTFSEIIDDWRWMYEANVLGQTIHVPGMVE